MHNTRVCTVTGDRFVWAARNHRRILIGGFLLGAAVAAALPSAAAVRAVNPGRAYDLAAAAT